MARSNSALFALKEIIADLRQGCIHLKGWQEPAGSSESSWVEGAGALERLNS